MEKHSAYYNLLEQLRLPDCPVCALASHAVDGLLVRYLDESVVHEDSWDRLKAAGGWCARHGRKLQDHGDGLAVSLFYGHLLGEEARLLEAGRPGPTAPGEGAATKGWLQGLGAKAKPPCPACAVEADTEGTEVRLLALGLEESEFWQALQAHPGLCVGHGRAVLSQAGPRKEDFARWQASRLSALAAELELFVRKSDHDSKEAMGAEADAWQRALRRYYGVRF